MNGVIKRSDPTDDYELLHKVGHGTYGEVYKARHIRNGDLAAVKVVKLEAGDNFSAIQQEILVLMDCKHSNIISYYGSYLKRDRLFIVMEYCSGGSLQDIYRMTGALTELQIAFVCRETLKGLQYLHQRRKVHRDVKGANILLTHSGDIKLADFGVAAQITATIGKRKSFVGTPYWMAPEVANIETRGGYGVECDVWAVGITAIELAETQPPLFNLHPMQVLYLMTMSNYKAPKLKEKKKWSATFHDFLKNCLTKNSKKRPSPAKLLNSHPFVVGALSSRLTRELLDRVNNPGTSYDSYPGLDLPPNLEKLTAGQLSTMNLNDENERPTRTSYHEEGTMLAKELSPVSPNGYEECNSEMISYDDDDDEETSEDGRQKNEDINRNISDQRRHDEINSKSTSLSQALSNNFVEPPPPRSGRPLSVAEFGNSRPSLQPSISAVEHALLPPRSKHLGSGERSMSLGAFHLRNHNRSLFDLGRAMVVVKKRRHFPNSAGGVYQNNRNSQMTPLSARPLTIFGLIPTPQVSMGACFFNILHNCNYQVNACASWTHPASQKQYLIIGAEEGIFTLDLVELHNNTPTMIHERKCTWLYVIDDVMVALQGKTPYLYRHDILQLMQQQLITQKITKTMTRIPEKYKPKVLLTTIRMPETRDCFKCCVERSVTNGNLYMGCAVPDAVLLFQWYEPLSRFIMMKRVDVNFGISSKILLKTPSLCSPFSLIFGSSASNSDFPLICIGVYKCKNDETQSSSAAINQQPERPPSKAVVARRKKQQSTSDSRVRFVLVDFNDTGKLEHFLARSSQHCGQAADQLFSPLLDPSSPDDLLYSLFEDKVCFPWQEKKRLDVVALKQLDRDTLFMAYDDRIVLTDLDGAEKVTDLMKTSFTFDFNIEFAVPLPDSVMAFHKHGIQGKSFFHGSVTQDLYDPSKIYKVIGNDSLITLKCRATTPMGSEAALNEVPPMFPMSSGGRNSQTPESWDLCILTGHVSTLTPP